MRSLEKSEHAESSYHSPFNFKLPKKWALSGILSITALYYVFNFPTDHTSQILRKLETDSPGAPFATMCTKYFELASLDSDVRTSLADIRVYEKCTLENGIDIGNIDSAMIPLYNEQFPNVSNEHGPIHIATQKSLWETLSKNLKGRGIVVGYSNEANFKSVLGLLKTLKFLKNKLPIQIVHSIPITNKHEIFAAATQDGPSQDISYVDATTLSENLPIEWVASLFNTFDEMVYMNANSVPIVPPAELFNNRRYTSTGLLFYRDRKSNTRNYYSYNALYQGYEPSALEAKLFDTIPLKEVDCEYDEYISRFPLDLFGSNYHSVVSNGLYLIDRKSHLVGLMVGLSLYMNSRSSQHDPKEFLWLGHILGGKITGEDITNSFNRRYPGISGVVETNNMVCSVCGTGVSHLSDERKANPELLWVNGENFSATLNLSQFEGAIIPSNHPYNDFIPGKNGEYCAYAENTISKSSTVSYKYSQMQEIRHGSKRLIHFDATQIRHLEHIMSLYG